MNRLLIMTLLLLGGCSSIPRATRDGRITDVWSQISTKAFIRVRGVGAVPPGVAGHTARRGASRNASLVAARYELLAIVKGVKLEGGVSISQLMPQSNVVREIVDDIVRGGEEVQSEWLADDGCVTTMELKRSTVEKLIQKGSPREKALTAEVAKLTRLLAVAIDGDVPVLPPDMVQAIIAKAEAFASAQDQSDALLARTGTDNPATMQEIIDVMNKIAAAKAMPVRPSKDASENKAFIDQIDQEVRGNHKHPGYTKEQWCVLFDTPDCHQ